MTKQYLTYFLVTFSIILSLWGSWKLERWINWKWDYGNRVEKRLEQIELRLERIENEHK